METAIAAIENASMSLEKMVMGVGAAPVGDSRTNPIGKMLGTGAVRSDVAPGPLSRAKIAREGHRHRLPCAVRSPSPPSRSLDLSFASLLLPERFSQSPAPR